MNFLFGCEDSINNSGFTSMIKREWIEPYIRIIYFYLFTRGNIKDARKIYDWCKIDPPFEPELVQEYYSKIFKRGLINAARDLYDWCKIEPNSKLIQEYYRQLLKGGYFNELRELYN
ncbi:MAG: hypothetical protein ACTSU2_03235 [Promethearchaeota archaeon]